MAFCMNCGTELEKDSHFCSECGTKVPEIRNNSERNIVYEGNIHKCPNCGEVLKSFVTNCSQCGFEIRGKESSNSIRDFSLKLEKIEAKTMPEFREDKSVIKKIFGKDFNEENEEEEARDNFEEEKRKQKANVIINYSVPNTKEDILEFMILAASNISVKQGIDDIVSKAWLSKLEQVYQRAEITMGNSKDFVQIKNIYENKKKEIKDKKKRTIIIAVSCVVGWFMLIGLLALME